MVNFCKGCDVHIIEAVAFLSQKGGQKWKIKYIWIKFLANIIQT